MYCWDSQEKDPLKVSWDVEHVIKLITEALLVETGVMIFPRWVC